MAFNDDAALQTVRETRLLIDQCDAWLFDEFSPYMGQRVLEIGCGLGNQIRYFIDRELIVGIDSCRESIYEDEQKFLDYPAVKVFNLSITDPDVLSLTDFEFDTAISVNVFEHIEEDRLAIAHTLSLLQPCGKFILVVPAHPWLYGSMDRSIGHYRRYTKKSLECELVSAGFRVIFQKYINMMGALGWLVNGRILRRRVPPTGQLRLINRLVPALRFFETLINPLFGISLLTISQKQ